MPSLGFFYRAARREYPRAWPVLLVRDLASFAFWRGLVAPARSEWVNLRLWCGRGRVGSRYWCPRVGDPVDACCSSPGRVAVAVSIRKDVVITADGHRHSLRCCVSPHLGDR